jgi:hypothetical protein
VSANPYQPGDRVRVLVDEPFSAPLAAGEIVTVVDTGTRRASDGTVMPVVLVACNLGQFLLGLDVVEAVEATPTVRYQPAEKDEVVDGIFEKMMRSDRELFTFALDADSALGAVDPEVSTQLVDPADEGNPTWASPGPKDVVQLTDYAGDELVVVYSEQDCPAHGREAAFFFKINDSDPVIIPVDYFSAVIAWFIDRTKHSHRPE